MVDTREDILARLLEVVATIPNIQSAQRNNVDIVEDQLPAAIVFDGDEETNDATDPDTPHPIANHGESLQARRMAPSAAWWVRIENRNGDETT